MALIAQDGMEDVMEAVFEGWETVEEIDNSSDDFNLPWLEIGGGGIAKGRSDVFCPFRPFGKGPNVRTGSENQGGKRYFC
jgi:hypothetical protein